MKLNILLVCLVLIFGCNKSVSPPPEVQKQLFSDSEDIEVGKKVIEAYEGGDWDNFNNYYAEDARIWRNKDWINEEGMTLNQYLEDLQDGVSSVENYRFSSNTWVSVITDEGEHWVFFWGIWEGYNTTTAKNYIIPVQISMHVIDGKISRQVDFFNNADLAVDLLTIP